MHQNQADAVFTDINISAFPYDPLWFAIRSGFITRAEEKLGWRTNEFAIRGYGQI
jgi:hypothetical protein